MIELTIPEQNKKLGGQVRSALTDKGLIVIVSCDQNWNMYVASGVLNAFVSNLGPDDRTDKVVAIGEEDQYSPVWAKFVNVKDVTSKNIVWAGALRDKEKIQDVVNLASTCIVISIMNTFTAKHVMERFQEYKVPFTNIESNLVVIAQSKVS